MNSNGRPTGGYTYKDERQENAVKQSRGGQPPRKKKRRFKPNKDGMLALGALVLIAVIVIILLVLTIKAIAGAVSSGNSDETSSSADTTAEIPVVKAWHEGYIQKSISSSEISSGELILVDYKTDSFPASTKRAQIEAVLKTRHSRQLGYYKLACERLFGTLPAHTYLYSFALNDVVEI